MMKVIPITLALSLILSFGLKFILSTDKTPDIEKINVGKYKTVLEASKNVTERNQIQLQESTQKSSFFDNGIIKQINLSNQTEDKKDNKKEDKKDNINSKKQEEHK